MQVLLAVLSFIDIVALTFLNGYWVRSPLSRKDARSYDHSNG